MPPGTTILITKGEAIPLAIYNSKKQQANLLDYLYTIFNLMLCKTA